MKTNFLLPGFAALALAFGISASAETFRNDEIKFGKPASGADKSVTFDQGLGVNNPAVRGASDGSVKLRANTVKTGKGVSANQIIEADLGLGSANPKLRYNATTSKWEFLNDGTTAKELGSGGGAGGGGVVLNENFGFEAGTANWTNSGGTFTTTTTLANVGFGLQAASWDASTTGEFLSYASTAIPAGLYGKVCTLSWYYKAGDVNLKMQVTDGTNIIAESAPFLASYASNYSPKQVMYFFCPTSGNLIARVASTANAAMVYLDDVKLGQEGIFESTAGPRSQIRLSQGNGFGSTNTYYRRFGQIREQMGTDIAYVDSPTLGAQFTVTTAGIYSVQWSDIRNTGTPYLGITKNLTNGTIPFTSVTDSGDVLATTEAYTSGPGHVTWTGYLPKNTTIQIHSHEANLDSGSVYTRLTFSKIGN